MNRFWLRLAAAAAALSAAIVPAVAHAAARQATVTGTVVAREQARGTLVVAAAHGVVRTLRTGSHARVGARVHATATRLADGTYRVTSVRTTGKAHRARLHGTVVKVAAHRLVLSAGGSVFAVTRARTTAAVGRSHDVQPGDVVDATVSIDSESGDVQESGVQVVGTSAFVRLEGTIQSLDASSLVLAVDRGAVTTIGIPSSLTLPSTIAVGDRVEVNTQYADGVFTLVTVRDDHAAAAGDSGSGDEHNGKVEAEGIVSALDAGTLTVTPEHRDPVTFAVPDGFDLGGVAVGDRVHAKGQTQSDGTIALVRLQLQHPEHADAVTAEGTVTALDSGSLTIAPEHGDPVTFTVPDGFDVSHVAVGDRAAAKGRRNADGSVTLVSLRSAHSSGHEPTGSRIEREGAVTAVGGGSLTVQPNVGDPVTYAVPDSVDVSSVQVGDRVDAVGEAQADGSIVLVSVEQPGSSGGSGDGGGDSGGDG